MLEPRRGVCRKEYLPLAIIQVNWARKRTGRVLF
jgi:hypothetical protein